MLDVSTFALATHLTTKKKRNDCDFESPEKWLPLKNAIQELSDFAAKNISDKANCLAGKTLRNFIKSDGSFSVAKAIDHGALSASPVLEGVVTSAVELGLRQMLDPDGKVCLKGRAMILSKPQMSKVMLAATNLRRCPNINFMRTVGRSPELGAISR